MNVEHSFDLDIRTIRMFPTEKKEKKKEKKKQRSPMRNSQIDRLDTIRSSSRGSAIKGPEGSSYTEPIPSSVVNSQRLLSTLFLHLY
jgi:hypothetical protein